MQLKSKYNFIKKVIFVLAIINLIIFVSCSSDDDEQISDTRFMLAFDDLENGYIFGSNSYTLIKKFDIDMPDEPWFYFNEGSGNIYIVEKRASLEKYITRTNVYSILSDDIVESEKITIPEIENETIVNIIASKDDEIYTLNSKEIGINKYDLILRKVVGDEAISILSFNEKIGFSNGYFPKNEHNCYYSPQSNFIFVVTNKKTFSSFYPVYIIDLSFNAIIVKSIPDRSFLKQPLIFSSLFETFSFTRKSHLGKTFDVLNSNSRGIIGEIELGNFDFGRSITSASIGYNSKNKKYEYILRGDAIRDIGYIDTDDFTLISYENPTFETHWLKSPLFFFDKK